MTYHNMSAGPWGLIYKDEKGRYFGTGITDLFRLLGKVPYGSEVVASGVTGEYTAFNADQSYSAAAMKSADGETPLSAAEQHAADDGRSDGIQDFRRRLEIEVRGGVVGSEPSQPQQRGGASDCDCSVEGRDRRSAFEADHPGEEPGAVDVDEMRKIPENRRRLLLFKAVCI